MLITDGARLQTWNPQKKIMDPVFSKMWVWVSMTYIAILAYVSCMPEIDFGAWIIIVLLPITAFLEGTDEVVMSSLGGWIEPVFI